MGIAALFLFVGGLIASVLLVIWGIVIHRRSTIAKGQSGMWFRFFFLSIGLTIATAIVTALVLLPDGGSGAPTGSDYLSVVAVAGLIGASPGLGTMFAALVFRAIRDGKEQ